MSNLRPVLLILTPGFPKDERDSTCMPAEQAFILSAKKNYPLFDIVVFSFQYPYHRQEYNWSGIRVIPFNGQNKGGLPRLLLRRKILRACKDLQAVREVKGVLSFWYGECAWAGKKISDQYNIPHYCWLLGQDARKANKYPPKLRIKDHQLIALSDFIRDEFEKNHGVRPAHRALPCIDINAFAPFTTEKDIDILAAGSLIPLKQYDVFLKVIMAIRKQLPGIKVVLAGDGPQKQRLQQQILESGLQSNVTLTGVLPHVELLRMMQRTKIFLHTSSYEGFGIVCAEALYAGAHVVSFTKPMHRAIDNWHIALDMDDMTKRTVELLKDPATSYTPVIIDEIKETVPGIMKLFL